jgi:hypothetical protein
MHLSVVLAVLMMLAFLIVSSQTVILGQRDSSIEDQSIDWQEQREFIRNVSCTRDYL